VEQVFLDLASKSGTSFQLGNVVTPAMSAMRSPDVTRDLLSLGSITLNVAAPGIFDKVDITDGAPLLFTVFDYALEVAPRSPEDENMIDVASLGAHAAFLRETFGDVDISPALITKIGQHAQFNINVQKNLEQLAERQDPQSQAD
jgi:hypothetical protein